VIFFNNIIVRMSSLSEHPLPEYVIHEWGEDAEHSRPTKEKFVHVGDLNSGHYRIAMEATKGYWTTFPSDMRGGVSPFVRHIIGNFQETFLVQELVRNFRLHVMLTHNELSSKVRKKLVKEYTARILQYREHFSTEENPVPERALSFEGISLTEEQKREYDDEISHMSNKNRCVLRLQPHTRVFIVNSHTDILRLWRYYGVTSTWIPISSAYPNMYGQMINKIRKHLNRMFPNPSSERSEESSPEKILDAWKYIDEFDKTADFIDYNRMRKDGWDGMYWGPNLFAKNFVPRSFKEYIGWLRFPQAIFWNWVFQ